MADMKIIIGADTSQAEMTLDQFINSKHVIKVTGDISKDFVDKVEHLKKIGKDLEFKQMDKFAEDLNKAASAMDLLQKAAENVDLNNSEFDKAQSAYAEATIALSKLEDRAHGITARFNKLRDVTEKSADADKLAAYTLNEYTRTLTIESTQVDNVKKAKKESSAVTANANKQEKALNDTISKQTTLYGKLADQNKLANAAKAAGKAGNQGFLAGDMPRPKNDKTGKGGSSATAMADTKVLGILNSINKNVLATYNRARSIYETLQSGVKVIGMDRMARNSDKMTPDVVTPEVQVNVLSPVPQTRISTKEETAPVPVTPEIVELADSIGGFEATVSDLINEFIASDQTLQQLLASTPIGIEEDNIPSTDTASEAADQDKEFVAAVREESNNISEAVGQIYSYMKSSYEKDTGGEPRTMGHIPQLASEISNAIGNLKNNKQVYDKTAPPKERVFEDRTAEDAAKLASTINHLINMLRKEVASLTDTEVASKELKDGVNRATAAINRYLLDVSDVGVDKANAGSGRDVALIAKELRNIVRPLMPEPTVGVKHDDIDVAGLEEAYSDAIAIIEGFYNDLANFNLTPASVGLDEFEHHVTTSSKAMRDIVEAARGIKEKGYYYGQPMLQAEADLAKPKIPNKPLVEAPEVLKEAKQIGKTIAAQIKAAPRLRLDDGYPMRKDTKPKAATAKKDLSGQEIIATLQKGLAAATEEGASFAVKNDAANEAYALMKSMEASFKEADGTASEIADTVLDLYKKIAAAAYTGPVSYDEDSREERKPRAKNKKAAAKGQATLEHAPNAPPEQPETTLEVEVKEIPALTTAIEKNTTAIQSESSTKQSTTASISNSESNVSPALAGDTWKRTVDAIGASLAKLDDSASTTHKALLELMKGLDLSVSVLGKFANALESDAPKVATIRPAPSEITGNKYDKDTSFRTLNNMPPVDLTAFAKVYQDWYKNFLSQIAARGGEVNTDVKQLFNEFSRIFDKAKDNVKLNTKLTAEPAQESAQEAAPSFDYIKWLEGLNLDPSDGMDDLDISNMWEKYLQDIISTNDKYAEEAASILAEAYQGVITVADLIEEFASGAAKELYKKKQPTKTENAGATGAPPNPANQASGGPSIKDILDNDKGFVDMGPLSDAIDAIGSKIKDAAASVKEAFASMGSSAKAASDDMASASSAGDAVALSAESTFTAVQKESEAYKAVSSQALMAQKTLESLVSTTAKGFRSTDSLSKAFKRLANNAGTTGVTGAFADMNVYLTKLFPKMSALVAQFKGVFLSNTLNTAVRVFGQTLGDAVRSAVEINAQAQQSIRSIATLIQHDDKAIATASELAAQKGTAAWQEIRNAALQESEQLNNVLREFSLQSTLTFEQASMSARKFLAAGVKAESILFMVQGAARAAAMSGESNDTDSIVRAMSQIYTKGKLYQEELRQLQEVGVPASEIIREQLQLSEEQMASIAKAGINGADALNALVEGMERKYPDAFSNAMKAPGVVFQNVKNQIAAITELLVKPVQIYATRALGDFWEKLNTIRKTLARNSLASTLQSAFGLSDASLQLLREFIARMGELALTVGAAGKALLAGIPTALKIIVEMLNTLLPLIKMCVTLLGSFFNTVNATTGAVAGLAKVLTTLLMIFVAYKAVTGIIAILKTLASVFMLIRSTAFGAIIAVGGLLAIMGAFTGQTQAFANKIVSFFTTMKESMTIDPNGLLEKGLKDYMAKWDEYLSKLQANNKAAVDDTKNASKKMKDLLSFDEVYRLTADDGNGDTAGDVGLGDTGEVPGLDDLLQWEWPKLDLGQLDFEWPDLDILNLLEPIGDFISKIGKFFERFEKWPKGLDARLEALNKILNNSEFTKLLRELSKIDSSSLAKALSKLDLSKIDFSKVDFSKIDMSGLVDSIIKGLDELKIEFDGNIDTGILDPLRIQLDSLVKALNDIEQIDAGRLADAVKNFNSSVNSVEGTSGIEAFMSNVMKALDSAHLSLKSLSKLDIALLPFHAVVKAVEAIEAAVAEVLLTIARSLDVILSGLKTASSGKAFLEGAKITRIVENLLPWMDSIVGFFTSIDDAMTYFKIGDVASGLRELFAGLAAGLLVDIGGFIAEAFTMGIAGIGAALTGASAGDTVKVALAAGDALREAVEMGIKIMLDPSMWKGGDEARVKMAGYIDTFISDVFGRGKEGAELQKTFLEIMYKWASVFASGEDQARLDANFKASLAKLDAEIAGYNKAEAEALAAQREARGKYNNTFLEELAKSTEESLARQIKVSAYSDQINSHFAEIEAASEQELESRLRQLNTSSMSTAELEAATADANAIVAAYEANRKLEYANLILANSESEADARILEQLQKDVYNTRIRLFESEGSGYAEMATMLENAIDQNGELQTKVLEKQGVSLSELTAMFDVLDIDATDMSDAAHAFLQMSTHRSEELRDAELISLDEGLLGLEEANAYRKSYVEGLDENTQELIAFEDTIFMSRKDFYDKVDANLLEHMSQEELAALKETELYGAITRSIEERGKTDQDYEQSFNEVYGGYSASILHEKEKHAATAKEEQDRLAEADKNIAEMKKRHSETMLADRQRLEAADKDIADQKTKSASFFESLSGVFETGPIATIKEKVSGFFASVKEALTGHSDNNDDSSSSKSSKATKGKSEIGSVIDASGIHRVKAYAAGGLIDSPQLVMAGEKNKSEAIIPLQNESYMKPYADAVANGVVAALAPVLEALAGSSDGGGTVNINAGTVVASDYSIQQFAQELERVQGNIRYRSGGR